MKENKNLVFNFNEPEAIIDSKILKAKNELRKKTEKEKLRQRKNISKAQTLPLKF